MKLLLIFLFTFFNAKVFIDESQNYFTDLRKLNDLVKSNKQLLTCFFENDIQLNNSLSCVDKIQLDLLEKHFAGHLDNIIKYALKKQPDCYHLIDVDKFQTCQIFIKNLVTEKTNFPIESEDEKNVLDQIVNIVLETFRNIQQQNQNKIQLYKQKPFLKNINDYIKNNIIANLIDNNKNKKQEVVQQQKQENNKIQNNVQDQKIQQAKKVKKDNFEEYVEISDKEKQEILDLQKDLQEDFDIHAYEDQFQLKNTIGINEDEFKLDLKNIDQTSNQLMANLVQKIENLQKQKEVKQNVKINLKFKNYQSDPERAINLKIVAITGLYNKTSSHLILIKQIEENLMHLFYKMLLLNNNQVPEDIEISKNDYFIELKNEIDHLDQTIDSDIILLQKHLIKIKSNSEIQIDQPLVEFQFEEYINKEIPQQKQYNNLRNYLDSIKKIKSDYELIRQNYQNQINELREQVQDLQLWKKMIDDLNKEIMAIENKIQNAKKKQFSILSIGIEEERITKLINEMTMLDKDRIKKMKLIASLKQEIENLRKNSITKAIEAIKEAIQKYNQILYNEQEDKNKIVQEIKQSIQNLKEKFEKIRDTPLIL